jgi:hypothetical protein
MKRMKVGALLVAFGVLLLIMAPVAISAQGGARVLSVSGALVNGTADGQPPAGLSTLLHIFSGDSDSVDTFETVTASDGGFVFEDVTAPSGGGSAVVLAEYGGTVYRQVLAPDELGDPIELTVYEPTQDVGVVATTEQSIIIAGIDAATRRLAAVQLLTLENAGDTTLVPDLSAPPVIGQFSFLRFSLPPNATDLDVATDLVGGEVIPVGTGFAITAPVQPGEHQVSFTFSVPYEGDTLAWRDNTLQGAGRFRLLMPSEFGEIGVGGLSPADSIQLSDLSYRVWQADDIAPGEGVNLVLGGLPEPNPLMLISRNLLGLDLWFGVVPTVVAVALFGLLVWGVWRRPGSSASGGAVES